MEGIQPDKYLKVIIVGASGHAAEIDDYLNYCNQRYIGLPRYEISGFIDDNPESYKKYFFSGPYLGDIQTHEVDPSSFYVMAIANIQYRKTIIQKLLSKGAHFLTFIHPMALVSKTAIIGQGVVIAPNVNIGPNVQIGDYNMINARASVGHDTVIGDYNFITPNVCFSGFTTIGDENMFGINSATIPNIVIGSNNTIAAGMIVDKNIGDYTTYFHRFKEKLIVIKNNQNDSLDSV